VIGDVQEVFGAGQAVLHAVVDGVG
jgi:hypothetical protein